jgi:ABC-type lipoprotein export system ATPase subunit
LTGPTGKIYEEIMNRLAEQFSDNQVKYEVITYNFRKKDHLDLASSYKNSTGNWIAYQACSSGQKTVLDVNFLSKIVTRLGILIMDEFLKHLDPSNHEACIELIESMNIGCIMLSSHMETIAAFNNKSCKLELNDSGVTKIILE